jgi:hypothetical protein
MPEFTEDLPAESNVGPVDPTPNSDDSGVRRGRTRYPATARIVIAGLVVLVVVLASVLVVTIPTRSVAATGVIWRYYTIPSGPAVSDNSVTIPPDVYCPPSRADGPALFSMNWTVGGGLAVGQVSLLTGASQPLVLYSNSDNVSGGTSFPTAMGGDCALFWSIVVTSVETLSVNVTTALSYNYTALAPIA